VGANKAQFGICIDGGGVGGIGACSFLEHTAPLLPQKVDFAGGTSVGSIVAALLALGYKYNQLTQIFHQQVQHIFQSPPMQWKLDPRKPRYQSKGLETALKNVLGASTRICDVQIPLFIVCHDWANGRAKVWDKTDGELLWEVVASSCSAPTWFPPRMSGLADGGTISNNPAVCTITGMMSKHGVSLSDMHILSLGTNGDYWKNPNVNQNTGKLSWANILLDNATRGNESMATFQAQALMGSQFLRIEPILSADYKLDDIGFMTEYYKMWQSLAMLRDFEVKKFVSGIPL